MSPEDSDVANLLWDEYKYRHGHCWKVVFQITAALVVLSVIPYTEKEVVLVLGRRVIAMPLLALGLIVFSFLIMWRELALFTKIKKAYRDLQERLNIVTHKQENSWFRCFVLSYLLNIVTHKQENSWFRCFVLSYLFCLFVLGLANLYFVWFKWIPHVLSLCSEVVKIAACGQK
jgi:hypothetical protein